ncbi:MAG: hypothetical protein HOQ16_02815, partial [Gemmatimonadaceae bacterium]|nr:hypothetical protein [Gemmatimonadaceae bacterium]
MPHPESAGAAAAPQPSPLTPPNAGEQERPLPAADERATTRPAPDALQQARTFAAAGETAAAMTTLRAIIAREPRHARARAERAE